MKTQRSPLSHRHSCLFISGLAAIVASGACVVPADGESSGSTAQGVTLVTDDSTPTVTSIADAHNLRAWMIQQIFGSATLPTSQPIVTPAAFPLPGMPAASVFTNLASVSLLTFEGIPVDGRLAYLLTPAQANGHAVIYNPGHTCTMAADGWIYHDQDTLAALVKEGFTVVAMFMPGLAPTTCTGHGNYFKDAPTSATLRHFVGPTVQTVSYLLAKGFADVSLAGLSGGGWTTDLAAAIDPRVRVSVSISGSTPIAFRGGGEGDDEQLYAPFYDYVGYSNLYVLGALEPGRRGIHVYNRRDNCCFGASEYVVSPKHPGLSFDQAMRRTEISVRGKLASFGATGHHRVEIDEMADRHQVSFATLHGVLLAELHEDRRLVAADSTTSAWVRTANGELGHVIASGTQGTGHPMTGLASVVEGALNPTDVFYRDPSNTLMRFTQTSTAWTAPVAIATKLASDPLAIGEGGASPKLDVFAIGSDGNIYHWPSGSAAGAEAVASDGLQAGVLAAAYDGGEPHVFTRGRDHAVYHFRKSGGAWASESLGGVVVGFPTAASVDGHLAVFAIGTDGVLYDRIQSGASWSAWSPTKVPQPHTLYGSPSARTVGPVLYIHARESSGRLAVFTHADSRVPPLPVRQVAAPLVSPWQLAELGTHTLVGSPLTIGKASVMGDVPTGVLRNDGTTTGFTSIAGWVD
jgi:hypothetical protein